MQVYDDSELGVILLCWLKLADLPGELLVIILLFIRWLEKGLQRGTATWAILEFSNYTGLLGLYLLDDVEDVVPRNESISHCFDISYLALYPIEDLREGILHLFACLSKVFHQLVLLPANDHSLQCFHCHFRSIADIGEVPFFISSKTVDNRFLITHGLRFAFHQHDDLILDVLIVQQHFLEKFVELA